MRMWSTRSVALATTVAIRGTVRGDLHLGPDGSILGFVRNTTNLTIIRPVIVAGRAVLHLSDLPPGATRTVRLLPSLDIHDQYQLPLWDQILGPSSTSGDLASWDGDPWEEPVVDKERSLTDRLRNVAERLPEAREITTWGEVLFAGWSEAPLGTFTVNGQTPQRRDLNLIVSPLSVRIPRGPFHLRQGTLGATLIDDRPQQPNNGCCQSPITKQAVALGPGGSATFQFDLPGGRHLHFRSLTLAANIDGIDETNVGQVYDWRARRWVHIALQLGDVPLPHPDRLISPSGALLIRFHATIDSGEIDIADPHQDLQLSGWGSAS
jgi:hypothetical protein